MHSSNPSPACWSSPTSRVSPCATVFVAISPNVPTWHSKVTASGGGSTQPDLHCRPSPSEIDSTNQSRTPSRPSTAVSFLTAEERRVPDDGVEPSTLDDHVGSFEHPVERLPPVVVGGDGRREAAVDDAVEPGAVGLTVRRTRVCLLHGDAQVVVRLVECLARLAAERQTGGDHAVGDRDGGRRSHGAVRPAGGAWRRCCARVVLVDLGGEALAQVDGLADGRVDVDVEDVESRPSAHALGSMCSLRSWSRLVRPSSELPRKTLSSTKENGRSRSSETSHSESLHISTAMSLMSAP